MQDSERQAEPKAGQTADKKAKASAGVSRWMPYFLTALIVFVLVFCINSLDRIRSLTGAMMQVLSPVLYGIALAYLCNPIHVFLKRHLDQAFFRKKGRTPKRAKLSGGIAIALTLAVLLLILFVLGYIIGPGLYNSLSDMIKNLPDMLSDAERWMTDMHLDTSWAGAFESSLLEALKSMQTSLENAIPSAVGSLVSALTSSIVTVVYQILSLVVGLVVMIYVLAEKERFARQAKMILFSLFRAEKANDILSAARHGNRIFSSFIGGKLLDSFIVGILCAIFMAITRMPYLMLISFIIGFTIKKEIVTYPLNLIVYLR